MEEQNDINIDPRLEEEGLMFYFTPKAANMCKMNKRSDAYRFSTHIMDSLLEKYKDHQGKVGFVAEDIETIKTSLALILEGYNEFIETAFLRDPIHLPCHPKYWNSDWEQDPLNINGG